MASIHLQGTLLDTLGEVDVGAVMTWTHLTNTGEVIATTKRDLIIPPNGFYSIDVEFGQIRIDYRTRNTERFIATVIVNGTSTATTIPELLNAAVPVTDPVIIQMQDILADAEAAAVTSEAFADQLTTFDLIGSVTVFAPDTNFRTKGYLTSGDGGAGHWVQNGVTAQPVSQSPAQLGDALLNDGNGNQWAMISSNTFEFETFAELESSLIGNVGQRLLCRERNNASYIVKPLTYSILPGDAQLSNSLVAELQIKGAANVLDFGAVIGGESTSAIQDAINRVGGMAFGGSVYSPAGWYNLSSELSNTHNNVSIIGDGPRISTWIIEHDLGFGLNVEHASSPGTSFVSNFTLENISIRTRVDTTQNAALCLNKVQQVYISNVMIEDHYGGLLVNGGLQHNYSNFNIYSGRTSAPVSWVDVKVGSFYSKLERASDLSSPVSIYISNSNMRRSESSDFIENGFIINAVDGLWCSNTHIMGVDKSDMLVEPINGTEQITGISLSNIWFDNNSDYGLRVKGNTTASFGRIIISNIRTLSQRVNAILVDSTSLTFQGVKVTGGSILKCGGSGVLIRAGGKHAFTGVEFAASNLNGDANKAGIEISGTAESVDVAACVFDKTGLAEVATSMIGVRVDVSDTSKVTVKSCNFDLDADDIVDSSALDHNNFPDNTTTKALLATAISGSTLLIPEIGTLINVSTGLDFNNLSGRWDGRVVTLYFDGVSVVSQGSLRLQSDTGFTTSAGDNLTLTKINGAAQWSEVSRKT